MDIASSQFFVVQADSAYLEGQYPGFAHVTEGMDMSMISAKLPLYIQDVNGSVLKEDQLVIESIQIIEEELAV